MQKNFKIPVNVLIERFPDKEIYSLQSVDSSQDISESDLEIIAKICSEELIYKVLFKEKFEGKPYTLESAKWFINWAKEGWDKNEWFVFLIRNPENKIVGAVDIKSNNLESAEIGYWMTNEVKGLMTNAVIELCNIAKSAGYKSLYGLTVLDNKNSQGVLVRAGFTNEGEIEKEGKEYLKFTKVL
ncbi:MAG TPA: GNAT family N-acetyltransferase [Alphaproteobacteria bacterium]|jgi:RimJ/RimL family protein N-acetyltransferase|nr:GNAT family N-acetyltransferase [Alphaproteobacteria bacterium]